MASSFYHPDHSTSSAQEDVSNHQQTTYKNHPSLPATWSIPRPSTVTSAMSGLLRRFATDPPPNSPHASKPYSNLEGRIYTPPHRTASPFQPPPLYPVILTGYNESTPETARLLSRALAEEIRLLVPPRLQLCEDWRLVYSLEEHGVSLGTLYKRCEDLRGLRNGYVLVVRDGEGGLFGAYLTDVPRPSAHYYGTGECFLWKASILDVKAMMKVENLPPPPSADTTHLESRITTIASSTSPSSSSSTLAPPQIGTGASTPERIRFKAFPYSGVNDYMMLCDQSFLSVGGGDGHYGLWLDDNFEKGISSACLTFGNEPLTEKGEKFSILGVELWSIGNVTS